VGRAWRFRFAPELRFDAVIRSRSDLHSWVAADLEAYGLSEWGWRQRLAADNRTPVVRFQRQLRRIEYLTNCRPPLARIRLAILWRIHVRQASRLGLTIPANVFGPGLCIAHYGTITVNPGTRIGARCRLHPSTTIGRSETGNPMIGDGCYIGPGARIIGGVTLGDNVTVGANAVVTSSFDDGAVLAGVPARQIGVGDGRWRH
jgi:serine O-acetyltransferase